MTMNLKEGSRCAVNHNEDLTAIDFDDDVSLAEKEVIMLSTARGAVVAAATTRAIARAVSRGVVGEEGELSVEKKVAVVASEGCNCNFWCREKGRGGRRTERWERRRSLVERRLWWEQASSITTKSGYDYGGRGGRRGGNDRCGWGDR
ncbi:hypothetical protein BHE74_00031802 [Ensete ventricosum]|nr:hypothetical protein BHE74_00031802 [Ensete ventricosum]